MALEGLVGTAIAMLSTKTAGEQVMYDFDLISLDYDLAGPTNGDAVAEAIAMSRNARPPVLAHSMNPRGAGRLIELRQRRREVEITCALSRRR